MDYESVHHVFWNQRRKKFRNGNVVDHGKTTALSEFGGGTGVH
jgi:hypothetical protein